MEGDCLILGGKGVENPCGFKPMDEENTLVKASATLLLLGKMKIMEEFTNV